MLKKIRIIMVCLLMLVALVITDGGTSTAQAECCDQEQWTKFYFLGQYCCFLGWDCTPCIVIEGESD
ncbi:hypothetical protein MJD09_25330 [bacterium]|nr:hypothetical protein [bacterium]